MAGRDNQREALLSAPQRQLIERYARAWSSSGRPGYIRWQNLYAALEEHEPGVEDAVEERITELKKDAPAARSRRKAEREQERWEKQALELDSWLTLAQQRRRYAGRDVWLYHGTSSELLPTILQYGLQPDVDERIWDEATPGYVYLTALYDGSGKGDASFYARRAAGHFGGEPSVLRVIVPFDELEPDEDDADIASGRHQFRNPHPVTRIMEIDGERVTR